MRLDVAMLGAREKRARRRLADGLSVDAERAPRRRHYLHRVTGDPASRTSSTLPQGYAAVGRIDYRVDLGANVAGLRLVANTLEFVDGAGVPRLRVAGAMIFGADSAAHEAQLGVSGCAVDVSPRAPWDHPVTPPGATRCTVSVTFDRAAVSCPAVLDPAWTTTGSLLGPESTANAVVIPADAANGVSPVVMLTGPRVIISAFPETIHTYSELYYDPINKVFTATGTLADVPRYSATLTPPSTAPRRRPAPATAAARRAMNHAGDYVLIMGGFQTHARADLHHAAGAELRVGLRPDARRVDRVGLPEHHRHRPAEPLPDPARLPHRHQDPRQRRQRRQPARRSADARTATARRARRTSPCCSAPTSPRSRPRSRRSRGAAEICGRTRGTPRPCSPALAPATRSSSLAASPTTPPIRPSRRRASSVYDPDVAPLGAFMLKTPLPTPRARYHVAGMVAGELLVVGGATSNCTSLDPDTHDCVCDGGTCATDTTGLASVDVYDPSLDSWTPGSALDTGRLDATAVEVAGKLLVVGGLDQLGGTILGTSELYDPASTSSGPHQTLNVPRYTQAMSLIPGVASCPASVLVAGGLAKATARPTPTLRRSSRRGGHRPHAGRELQRRRRLLQRQLCRRRLLRHRLQQRRRLSRCAASPPAARSTAPARNPRLRCAVPRRRQRLHHRQLRRQLSRSACTPPAIPARPAGTPPTGATPARSATAAQSAPRPTAFKDDSVVCRPSAGECDVDDHCSGSAAACPGDDKVAPNTSCTNDSNALHRRPLRRQRQRLPAHAGELPVGDAGLPPVGHARRPVHPVQRRGRHVLHRAPVDAGVRAPTAAPACSARRRATRCAAVQPACATWPPGRASTASVTATARRARCNLDPHLQPDRRAGRGRGGHAGRAAAGCGGRSAPMRMW